MHIKALHPASLIEFPGHIADILYTGGCSFRCPFCYNVDLVLTPGRLPDLDKGEILNRLEARRRFVDGVVITGGEPTLQPDLLPFMHELHRRGLVVKLDTNGYQPDVLEACLAERAVDYVATDIKSSLPRYSQAAGVPVDTARIERSIRAILASGVAHEFRTTVVPGLVTIDDVRAIASVVAGAARYYLQAYRSERTLALPHDGRAPDVALLQAMAAVLAPHVGEVGLRGVPQPL